MTSDHFDRRLLIWGLGIGAVGIAIFVVSVAADAVAGGVIGAIVAVGGLGTAGYEVLGLWVTKLFDRWARWYNRRHELKQERAARKRSGSSTSGE